MPAIVLAGPLAAHCVPFKGGAHDWTVEQLCRDTRKWGIMGDMIIRHDQEVALEDLAGEVIKRRAEGKMKTDSRVFEENSAVGDSRANGFIESGVKSLEGLVRTHKGQLEERIQQHRPCIILLW